MALDITDERVAAAAAGLRGDGWFFSPRQLYYAVCASVETAPTRIASGEVGLGVLLVLIGALTGHRVVLAVLGVAGLLLLIVGVVTHLQERRPLPLSRLLAISYADFENRFLGEPQRYPGLVTPAQLPAPGQAALLVACDRADTAAVVHANRSRVGGDIAVVTAAQLPGVLAGRRVVCVHDCDPSGCSLAAELRDAGAEVIDAGINPAELSDRRLQLIEGAPARLPRDLSGHLDAAQVDWLCSGRRLEIATEPPEQLAQRLRGAIAGSSA